MCYAYKNYILRVFTQKYENNRVWIEIYQFLSLFSTLCISRFVGTEGTVYFVGLFQSIARRKLSMEAPEYASDLRISIQTFQ